MNQQYFVVDFAHSVHGRVKRIQISYKSLAYLFCTVCLAGLTAFGLFSSYLRMSWKVSHYNELRADFDRLRSRYQELQLVSRQHNEQMASLETLANEVTVAYGLHEPVPAAPTNSAGIKGLRAESSLTPTIKESIEEYNFLKAANFSEIYHHYAYQWQSHSQPSLWPVTGLLRSSFGGRSDPFSGEGAFHTGIDLAAPAGTPVHVTADGVVTSACWSGAYGKLVVVNHGNGFDTYYAHLSQFLIVPGQEVRRGEVIALSGGTGRATGPHMHYEVRLHGTPINPYRYLGKAPHMVQGATPGESDLGL
jgi:murein DD-endopeptidase MepM/ murein hydrolase activator NlpD